METKSNIQAELQNIAPSLANLSKHEGYIVPKNYFNTLNLEVLSMLTIETSVQRKEGFDVPKNYFESFNARVLQKIEAEKKSHGSEKYKEKTRNMYRQFAPIAGIAATLALLIMFVVSNLGNTTPNQDLQEFVAQANVLDPVVQAMLFNEEASLLMGIENMDWIGEESDEIDTLLDKFFDDEFAGFEANSI